jgi:hypothetical protein
VALAERGQRALVAVLRTADEDRVGKPLVDKDVLRSRVSDDSTAAARDWLHGARTLDRMEQEA